jgi:hypothetical protein
MILIRCKVAFLVTLVSGFFVAAVFPLDGLRVEFFEFWWVFAPVVAAVLTVVGYFRRISRSRFTVSFPVELKKKWDSDESFAMSFRNEGSVYSFKDHKGMNYIVPWVVWRYLVESIAMQFLFALLVVSVPIFLGFHSDLTRSAWFSPVLFLSPFLGMSLAVNLFLNNEDGAFLATPHTRVWVERTQLDKIDAAIAKAKENKTVTV